MDILGGNIGRVTVASAAANTLFRLTVTPNESGLVTHIGVQTIGSGNIKVAIANHGIYTATTGVLLAQSSAYNATSSGFHSIPLTSSCIVVKGGLYSVVAISDSAIIGLGISNSVIYYSSSGTYAYSTIDFTTSVWNTNDSTGNIPFCILGYKYDSIAGSIPGFTTNTTTGSANRAYVTNNTSVSTGYVTHVAVMGGATANVKIGLYNTSGSLVGQSSSTAIVSSGVVVYAVSLAVTIGDAIRVVGVTDTASGIRRVDAIPGVESSKYFSCTYADGLPASLPAMTDDTSYIPPLVAIGPACRIKTIDGLAINNIFRVL